ncbi:MAG: hypothetical protein WA610_09250, partial [Thermodesulfovibrionales bacterium]
MGKREDREAESEVAGMSHSKEVRKPVCYVLRYKLHSVIILSLALFFLAGGILNNNAEAVAQGYVVTVDGMNPDTIIMNDQSPTDYLYS